MEIELFGNKLKVFECGKVLVIKQRNPNKGEYYEKKYSMRNGYKLLQLSLEAKRKDYTIHRIIGFAYLGLDIGNSKIQIDHINRDKLDNKVSNLRIVSHQQNQFNRNAKGYYKEGNKYRVKLMLNNKQIYLGRFDTEEEAHNAYLIGKEIHHPLPQ
tara:strand:+ start:28 stop:495 length:468 start_codon:yes stop_codon:yes gene_type:complete